MPRNENLKRKEEMLEDKMKSEADRILANKIIEKSQAEKDSGKFILAVGIIGPLLAVFQAIKIFATQNASGLSVTYWGAYLIIASAWLGYGIYNKNKPIMISYSLWILVEIAILNGIFLFS